eukprot:10936881-Lingulodinium_polyedra.AAC.1
MVLLDWCHRFPHQGVAPEAPGCAEPGDAAWTLQALLGCASLGWPERNSADLSTTGGGGGGAAGQGGQGQGRGPGSSQFGEAGQRHGGFQQR